MSALTQVVWQEGLFLKPQHFQHQQRFHQAYAEQHFQQHAYPAWGWRKLDWEVRPNAIVIRNAQGCCRDGTPIVINEDQPLEIPIPEGVKDKVVFIGLPTGDRPQGIRHTHHGLDHWAATPSSARIEVATWAWQGCLGGDSLHPMQRLPLVKIDTCQTSGHIVLCDTFIPPCVQWQVASHLITELTALQQQLPQHYQRFAQADQHAMMRAVHGFQAQWQQFLHQPTGHPQQAFYLWLQLYSALLATDSKHLLMDWPIYQHEHPAPGWQALLTGIKKCLSQAVEPTCWALSITQQSDQDIQLHFPKADLWQTHYVVLAIASTLPKQQVAEQFSQQVTIGAVQELPQLINLQLPGIPVQPLRQVPEGIPTYREYSYFQLDAHHPQWQKVLDAMLALHVSQPFAQCTCFAWAVKGER